MQYLGTYIGPTDIGEAPLSCSSESGSTVLSAARAAFVHPVPSSNEVKVAGGNILAVTDSAGFTTLGIFGPW